MRMVESWTGLFFSWIIRVIGRRPLSPISRVREGGVDEH